MVHIFRKDSFYANLGGSGLLTQKCHWGKTYMDLRVRVDTYFRDNIEKLAWAPALKRIVKLHPARVSSHSCISYPCSSLLAANRLFFGTVSVHSFPQWFLFFIFLSPSFPFQYLFFPCDSPSFPFTSPCLPSSEHLFFSVNPSPPS